MSKDLQLYSKNSRDFLSRFTKRMEKEQAQLWEGEIYKYREKDWGELDEKEMEEILKSSFHRELFEKEKKRFLLFREMIPGFDRDHQLEKEIMTEALNLMDYLYCLHGYYGFWDRVRAKASALWRRRPELD